MSDSGEDGTHMDKPARWSESAVHPNQQHQNQRPTVEAVGSLRDLLESLRFDGSSGGGGEASDRYMNNYPNNNTQGGGGGQYYNTTNNGGTYSDSEIGQVYGDESENEKYGGNNARMFHKHSNPNITDNDEYGHGQQQFNDDDDDNEVRSTQSYSGSGSQYSSNDDGTNSENSSDSSDSVKSYEDAGYDNEEDYLFDQYGGIGGTSEERAELAEALMHTLNVGPMADDLFYEEVAMCFLRCRERHRMRTRREELRERKKGNLYIEAFNSALKK